MKFDSTSDVMERGGKRSATPLLPLQARIPGRDNAPSPLRSGLRCASPRPAAGAVPNP